MDSMVMVMVMVMATVMVMDTKLFDISVDSAKRLIALFLIDEDLTSCGARGFSISQDIQQCRFTCCDR